MRSRRSFDESVARYGAYAARVAALSPDAWDRLRLRCADLDDPSFRALMERAFLAAKPHRLWVPPNARRHRTLHLIAWSVHTVQTSIALVAEFAAEFEASTPGAIELPRPRTRSTGRPRSDAFIDANFLIESGVTPLARSAPGVAAVVRSAGRAVLGRGHLSPSDFDAVYGYIEPEIPFAELTPPAA